MLIRTLLTVLAVSTALPAAEDPCFQQVCTAVYIDGSTGSTPSGTTYTVTPGTAEDGEGTLECATCPDKPCSISVDVEFNPAPANTHYIDINGRRPGTFNDTVTAKKNCIQADSVEIIIKVLSIDGNNEVATYDGSLSCLCEPVP